MSNFKTVPRSLVNICSISIIRFLKLLVKCEDNGHSQVDIIKSWLRGKNQLGSFPNCTSVCQEEFCHYLG